MSSSKNTYNRRTFINKSSFSFASIAMVGLPFQGVLESSCKRGEKEVIPTVSGEIACSKLGSTLMHEHVLFGNIPDNMRTVSVEIAVKLLNVAAKAGVQTIVDVTPYRDIHLYSEIAEKSNLTIIVSTGYYTREKMPLQLQNITEAQLEKRMFKEVTEGIDNTKIKAGIIKVAADNQELNAFEKMVFRVAARVSKATKVPIATHAWIGARPQFDLLVKSGADPNHINLSHIETVPGWRGKTREQIAEEFLPIVKNGGYLLFNNFSCEFYTPWQDMVYLLKYYCDKGFSNRIFISEDCNWEWKKGRQVFEAEEEHPEAAKRTYSYMMEHELPLILNSGFTKEEINTFLIDNPRNYFTVNN